MKEAQSNDSRNLFIHISKAITGVPTQLYSLDEKEYKLHVNKNSEYYKSIDEEAKLSFIERYASYGTKTRRLIKISDILIEESKNELDTQIKLTFRRHILNIIQLFNELVVNLGSKHNVEDICRFHSALKIIEISVDCLLNTCIKTKVNDHNDSYYLKLMKNLTMDIEHNPVLFLNRLYSSTDSYRNSYCSNAEASSINDFIFKLLESLFTNTSQPFINEINKWIGNDLTHDCFNQDPLNIKFHSCLDQVDNIDYTHLLEFLGIYNREVVTLTENDIHLIASKMPIFIPQNAAYNVIEAGVLCKLS